MELKLAVLDRKLDHLCLFDVESRRVHLAREIEGHQWIFLHEGGYNKYPVTSFWAIVATFPDVKMAPATLKIWNKLNGRDTRVDIHAERDMEIPRFKYENLPVNKYGKRQLRPVQLAAIEINLEQKTHIDAIAQRGGKSTIYFATHLKVQELKGERIKSMIVCPPNVKWELWRQANEYIDDVGVVVVEGDRGSRKWQIEQFLDDPHNELLIIGYQSLVTHIEEYHDRLEARVTCRFVDESHYLLYPWTKRTQATKSIRTEYIILGTGTPSKGGIHHLWAQMNDVDQTFYPDRVDENGDILQWGMEMLEEEVCIRKLVRVGRRRAYKIFGYKPSKVKPLLDRIHTKMLRVSYKEIVGQMPLVAEPPILVELDKDHRKFYRELKKKLKGESERGEMNAAVIAMRLRQASSNPRKIDPDSTIVGTKIQEAVAIVDNIDEQSVVMCESPDTCDVVEELLNKETELRVCKVTTRTHPNMQDRFAMVRMFQTGEYDVYLSTIGISKEGIQLDKSNTMVLVDGNYDPVAMMQVAFRCMNPDKTDPITIYHLLGKDTIDPRVYEACAEKELNIGFWIDRELSPGRMDALAAAVTAETVRAELAEE